MNENLRKRIIEYNKQKQIKESAYEDFMIIITALEGIKRLLPTDIKKLINKYKE